jgi:adenylate cyclase
MGAEIERNFLVDATRWRPEGNGSLYRQGYLTSVPDRVVRVHVAENDAFLTVKGASHNITRLEFEYQIPRLDAETILNHLCERPIVEKTRFKQTVRGKVWEIDVFHSENERLVRSASDSAEIRMPICPRSRSPHQRPPLGNAHSEPSPVLCAMMPQNRRANCRRLDASARSLRRHLPLRECTNYFAACGYDTT